MESAGDWRNIEYLRKGNEKQQKAYHVLQEINILSILKDFDPIVAGTIPIGIDIESSDIDILCHVSDFDSFIKIVQNNFSYCDRFSEKFNEEQQAYVSSFFHDHLEIEIFAQSKPSEIQNGFRHMLIENRILRLAGEKFRQKIINLKKQGYKTEPAFGKLLNLDNPYSDLLDFEKLSDIELKNLFKL
ncbi:MAG TPA: DUF4269 domain-containing protein [Dysgonomonas sp.]|nr:DUF4269 domain-containing protein [Dysgonomonas sp.]